MFAINCAVPTKLRWSDAGSGAHQDFSCYAPDLRPEEKDRTVGNFGIKATPDGAKPKVYGVSVTTEQTEDIFKRPLSFEETWKDRLSGADEDGSFWRVNCPGGFGSLSDLCKSQWSEPSVEDVWCINERYLEDDPRTSVIWEDKGSGAINNVLINGGQQNHTKELISTWSATLKRIKPELIKFTNC